MPPGKRCRPEGPSRIRGRDLPRHIPVAWFTLYDAGKNPESFARARTICDDYGLYLPEEITALRAAEKAESERKARIT